MKSGSWKVPAGVVLGVAGGFLLRPVVVTERGDLHWPGGDDSTEASAAGSEALAGKSEARESGTRSAGSPLARLSSGDAVADVRELIAMIDVEGDPMKQINLMELIRRVYLLTQLRESEVADVLAGLSKEGDRIGYQEISQMAGVIALTRLAELNGPEALRLMCAEDLAWMSDNSDDWLPAMVMNSWVAADPEGAKRWFEGGVKQLEQEEMQELMENEEFRQAYYDGMAKHDPGGLAREIGDDSDHDKRDDVMVALVRNAKAPDDLVGLLDQCTGSSDARTEAIERLSAADPAAAANWVEKQVVDDVRDDDIRTVGLAMMDREGRNGIEWYLAQELGDQGNAGDRLSNIAQHLAEDDLEKAAEWVESQPDDAPRDSAEIAMAWETRGKDLDKAMGWLTRVDDVFRRTEALRNLLRVEWDHRADRLPEHVIEAAERAGMGEAARTFKPD